jgi:sugar phosphate isomerase/epimerase
MARDFDLSYIELRATEGSVELPKLFKERFGHPDSLARYLDDQQVNICCLDTSLKLVGNDEVGRKAFLEFLPWADALGTTALRVFDGGTMEHGLDDEAFAQAQDTINWWKQEKERSGWETDMGIETHDALVGSESIDRIFKSNPDLNIIWDTHHTWKKSNDSIETSWNHLGPNVNNVHVKDSISVPSARHLFTYVNFGEGEFPLDETLRLLQCQGYKGFVTIEWERMWHPYMSDIREALQKARDLNWF